MKLKKELKKILQLCKYMPHRATYIKFIFSQKATHIEEILTVDWTFCSMCK